MKIAQVCPRYYPYTGGIETLIGEITERLTNKGFRVEVLTTDPSGELPKDDIINGVKVKRFDSWAPNENYHFSKKLKKYLIMNSDNYDVVHAHSYHDFPALYAAQAKGRNKLVFNPHYHGTGHTWFRNLLHIPYRLLWRKIFCKVDMIICVSNYERSLIMRHFKIDDERVMVIPNGVDLEEFKAVEKKRKSCRVILYVGRLEKYKGVQYLIMALPKLANDTILEIVGKGPYKRNLVKLARKLRIEDRVKFYQDLSRKELLQKYSDTDIFALLSKHEAYGIGAAEALASGTPCILANMSALTEWVDNENCFGVEYPINLDELAKLVDKVVGKRTSGVKLCDWNDTVKELTKIYEEC